MLGWEYCTIDLSAVAFAEMRSKLAMLERRGWQLSPLQPAGTSARLRLSMRRAVSQWARLRAWFRDAV
jgi:hypothetical protein